MRKYFGSWGYADDLGLIAPSRDALQMMINIFVSLSSRSTGLASQPTRM